MKVACNGCLENGSRRRRNRAIYLYVPAFTTSGFSVSQSSDHVSKEGERNGGVRSKNWPLVRKVEALVFLAMFCAVPLFAFRVLQYTHSQLMVRNVCRELVHDLGRAKVMAVKRNVDVQVAGGKFREHGHELFAYTISTPTGVAEEIVLPENVSVVGTVSFRASGAPVRPSSFIVSSFNRNLTVEIDKIGVVSVP